MTFSPFSVFCVSIPPIEYSLASVYNEKGLLTSGYPSIGASINLSFK